MRNLHVRFQRPHEVRSGQNLEPALRMNFDSLATTAILCYTRCAADTSARILAVRDWEALRVFSPCSPLHLSSPKLVQYAIQWHRVYSDHPSTGVSGFTPALHKYISIYDMDIGFARVTVLQSTSSLMTTFFWLSMRYCYSCSRYNAPTRDCSTVHVRFIRASRFILIRVKHSKSELQSRHSLPV